MHAENYDEIRTIPTGGYAKAAAKHSLLPADQFADMSPDQVEKHLRSKLKGLYGGNFEQGLKLPNIVGKTLETDDRPPKRLPPDMLPKRRTVSKSTNKPLE